MPRDPVALLSFSRSNFARCSRAFTIGQSRMIFVSSRSPGSVGPSPRQRQATTSKITFKPGAIETEEELNANEPVLRSVSPKVFSALPALSSCPADRLSPTF